MRNFFNQKVQSRQKFEISSKTGHWIKLLIKGNGKIVRYNFRVYYYIHSTIQFAY